MADFHLWQKDTLVKFAEDATVKMAEQEREIKDLQDQVRAVHVAWKSVLRESVADATVTP